MREFDFYYGDTLLETYSEIDFDGEGITRSEIEETSADLAYNKSGTPVVACPRFGVLCSFKINLFLSSERHSRLIALIAEHHRRLREGNTGPAFLTLWDRSRYLIEPAPRSRPGGFEQPSPSPLILKYFADFRVVVRIVDAFEVAGKAVDGLPLWKVELEATEALPASSVSTAPQKSFVVDFTAFTRILGTNDELFRFYYSPFPYDFNAVVELLAFTVAQYPTQVIDLTSQVEPYLDVAKSIFFFGYRSNGVRYSTLLSISVDLPGTSQIVNTFYIGSGGFSTADKAIAVDTDWQEVRAILQRDDGRT
jgi:hypothetical protein